MIKHVSTTCANEPASHKRKRGFTLTEIAIVLGIIGLILGAIWGAASAVYSNKKTADAEQGIIATVQAVRSLFAASNNTAAASVGANITAPGMFPPSWVNYNATASANEYGNPWAPSSTTSTNTFAYVIGDSGNPTQFGV